MRPPSSRCSSYSGVCSSSADMGIHELQQGHLGRRTCRWGRCPCCPLYLRDWRRRERRAACPFGGRRLATGPLSSEERPRMPSACQSLVPERSRRLAPRSAPSAATRIRRHPGGALLAAEAIGGDATPRAVQTVTVRGRYSRRHADDDIATLRRILHGRRTIAVVGLSAEWHRPSNFAAKYMQQHGYRIVPVNPRYAGSEVLGERCYASLERHRRTRSTWSTCSAAPRTCCRSRAARDRDRRQVPVAADRREEPRGRSRSRARRGSTR